MTSFWNSKNSCLNDKYNQIKYLKNNLKEESKNFKILANVKYSNTNELLKKDNLEKLTKKLNLRKNKNQYDFIEDILLIDVSESFDEIGHVVYNQHEKGLIGNHIIHLHSFKNCNSKWLYYYLKTLLSPHQVKTKRHLQVL